MNLTFIDGFPEYEYKQIFLSMSTFNPKLLKFKLKKCW